MVEHAFPLDKFVRFTLCAHAEQANQWYLAGHILRSLASQLAKPAGRLLEAAAARQGLDPAFVEGFRKGMGEKTLSQVVARNTPQVALMSPQFDKCV